MRPGADAVRVRTGGAVVGYPPPGFPQGHLPGYHRPGTLIPIGAVASLAQRQAPPPAAPGSEFTPVMPTVSPWDDPALPAIATWPAPVATTAAPQQAARAGQTAVSRAPRHGMAAATPGSRWRTGRGAWLI